MADRTPFLLETISGEKLVEFSEKMRPIRNAKAKDVLARLGTCEDLAFTTVDELWSSHKRLRLESSVFIEIAEFRDLLIENFSKPKIQYIRDEFSRIGVETPSLLENAHIFDVQWHYDRLIVSGSQTEEFEVAGEVRRRARRYEGNFEELRKILASIPSQIGEAAFWEAIDVLTLNEELEKKHHDFYLSRVRELARKTLPKVIVQRGRYAGKSAWLIENFGKRAIIEIQQEAGDFIHVRIPSSSL